MPAPTPDELLEAVQSDFPRINFKPAPRFSFRPPRTIFYAPTDTPHFRLLLLHELGHFSIGQTDYTTDLSRIRIERAAWDAAADFCTQYGVEYDSVFVEICLDSYRDWLHTRSKCRRCGLTMYQDLQGRYRCPNCD